MDITTCEYIGANCAITPGSMTFFDDDTIVFGFSDQVGIYKVKENKIISNINSGEFVGGRVNCVTVVQWQRKYLCVGYDSGHLAFYCCEEGEWKHAFHLQQSSGISLIHANFPHLITINNNAQIIHYHIQPSQEEFLPVMEKLAFPYNRQPQALTTFIEGSQLVMFVAGIDKQIYCYSKQKNDEFIYSFMLSGHENAIMRMDIVKDGADYLLASCSQDGYIRVWRVTDNIQLAKFYKNVKSLQSKRIFLDSVLISHECSVTCVMWAHYGGLKLVSCSLDCTICVWDRDEQGAWSVETRMGQFLGNKNAYFNLAVDEHNSYLVGVNYIGSVMIWKHQEGKFRLMPSFNGHSNEVRSLDWNHSGDFLVSVSKDQTTRIIAQNKVDGLYHEISRAQVHGYDINSVATLKLNDSLIDLVVCGADEKVLRVIEPPACFANYLNTFTNANLHLYFPNALEEQKFIKQKASQNKPLLYETYAEGGVQVLGLMTKMQRIERQKITSYYQDEEPEQVEEQAVKVENKDALNFNQPPHDDYLVKHTLWPEMQKLYGHPHEISCVRSKKDGSVIASACTGLNKMSCMILIWETKEWKWKNIEYHSYTIYDMKFSNHGEFLVSVGKDRKLGVFNRDYELMFGYEAHSRAITSVDVSLCDKYILTGSRDKLIKIHSVEEKKCICELNIKKPIHAVAFCGNQLLAYGCDDGTVGFLNWKDEKLLPSHTIQPKYSPTKTISCLSFKSGKLAVGSHDNSVRIFSLQ